MPSLTESEVRKMKVSQLKAALKERSLSQSGLKAVLVSRLLDHIKENDQDDDDEEVDDLLSDNGDNASLNNEIENENDEEIDNLLNETEEVDNNNTNSNINTSNSNDNENKKEFSPKSSQKFMTQFEKLIKKQERIARFGMTQEKDRIAARKARFGKGGSDFSIKSLMNNENNDDTFTMELLEKRRQRWGDEAISLSIAKEKATRSRKYVDIDEEIKKEERRNRFGSNNNDNINLNNDDITLDNDKIKSRMQRFGTDLNNINDFDDNLTSNKKRKINNNGIYFSDNDDDVFQNVNIKEQNDNLLDMSLDELSRKNRNRNFNNRSRRGRFYNNNNNNNGRMMRRGRGFNRGRGRGNLWRQRRNQQRFNNGNNNNNFDRSRSRRNRNNNYRPFNDNDFETNSNAFEDYDNILQRGDIDRANDFNNDFDELGDINDDINNFDEGIHDFYDSDDNDDVFQEDPMKKQQRLLRFEKDWR